MDDRRARVVVGFDGSPHSLGALNWALTEARLRDAVVVLCHVTTGRPSGHLRQDRVRQATNERMLATGVRYAARRAPTVDVVSALMAGRPADRLVEAASDAALLVVGARGDGGAAGPRLGSVSARIARHGHGTVIIAPGLGDRVAGGQDRRIVVGVDGATGSGAAVDFAFAEAARRQARVCAVHVFDASTMQLVANLSQAGLVRLHVKAADTLRAVVAVHAEHYPDVEVTCEVLSGAPASRLTSAAANSELLVLGSRGHSGIVTRMLGSTTGTVLDTASCPVALVRAGQRPHPPGSTRRERPSLVDGRS